MDADGALFDAALLSAIAAFSHCKIFFFFSSIVHITVLVLIQLTKTSKIIHVFICSQISKCLSLFSVQIPVVSLDYEGKVVLMSEEQKEQSETKPVNKGKRKLTLNTIPFSLTSILHKTYILADPTSEEESIMDTFVTVVLDSSGQLVSLYKPGGSVLTYTSAVQVIHYVPHFADTHI